MMISENTYTAEISQEVGQQMLIKQTHTIATNFRLHVLPVVFCNSHFGLVLVVNPNTNYCYFCVFGVACDSSLASCEIHSTSSFGMKFKETEELSDESSTTAESP